MMYDTDQKPVLLFDAIYLGDNGRVFCGGCAGERAMYTGRDISGQRVQRITRRDLIDWRAEMGDCDHDPECEGCGKGIS